MRGLKLFVRLGEPPDLTEVAAFLDSCQLSDPGSLDNSRLSAASSQGDPNDASESLGIPAERFLIGKLLGELVAVVRFDAEGSESLRVDCIVVRDGLRGKRIGRVMLRELEIVATKLERRWIVINEAGNAEGFFRAVGFRSEGERWVKSVAAQSS